MEECYYDTFEKIKYDFTSHYISGDWYIKKMAFSRAFEYIAAVLGYHYFKTIWQSKENEVLDWQFENRNSYAMFAIKTCNPRGTMVGHLPLAVSWCSSICYVYQNTS